MRWSLTGTFVTMLILLALFAVAFPYMAAESERLSDRQSVVAMCNETVNKVIDSREFRAIDRATLQSRLESRYSSYSIEVKRYTRTLYKDGADLKVTYILSDHPEIYQQGDLFEVVISKTSPSRYQSYITNLLGIKFEENDVRLVGGVR